MGLTIINKKGHVIAATPDYWKAQKAAEKRAERAARAAEKRAERAAKAARRKIEKAAQTKVSQRIKARAKERKATMYHAKKTLRKIWHKLI